jgi:hypothetical protein
VVFSTNRNDCHDITEILLKVTLNTINPNPSKNYFKKIQFHVCISYFPLSRGIFQKGMKLPITFPLPEFITFKNHGIIHFLK